MHPDTFMLERLWWKLKESEQWVIYCDKVSHFISVHVWFGEIAYALYNFTFLSMNSVAFKAGSISTSVCMVW